MRRLLAMNNVFDGIVRAQRQNRRCKTQVLCSKDSSHFKRKSQFGRAADWARAVFSSLKVVLTLCSLFPTPFSPSRSRSRMGLPVARGLRACSSTVPPALLLQISPRACAALLRALPPFHALFFRILSNPDIHGTRSSAVCRCSSLHRC